MTVEQQGPRRRRGFSLIEVVVAMTLLAFVIGSLSVLATRTSERARRADIIAKRNYVVVQQLNRYSGLPYDTLRARINTNPTRLDTIKGYNMNFLRRDTVANYPTSAAGDTLIAEVRVTIIPLTTNVKDTMLKDSVVIHRRNPNRYSPLFTP
ncbi:MAG: prepilin-type N-terminal cleavage/methylation domain-containing protein [Gemmatimonadota bacterium]